MDEGTPVAEPARYAAFLSYSHKDSAQARWLHRRLETYRIPRRLVGTPGEHGRVPARLTPIFRDREELPAAGDLSERIRAALAASDHLVILCSPNSAASPWVAKEIAAWRELCPGRTVYAAILDGEPGDCFPCGLAEAGAEPLAADFRPHRDGRRLGLLKLVAGLGGIGVDSLVQRDAARRIRRVMAVTAGALIAVLAMAVMTALALNARREAQQQRAEAEGLVEFMLTDLRERLKGVGRLDVLTAVNERALGYYRAQKVGSLTADSLERRARILLAMGEDDLTRGNVPEAAALFEQAKRTTAALLEAAPDDFDRLFAHAQSIYWGGAAEERRGDYEAAARAYLSYLAVAERMYRLAPGRAKAVGELAYAESNLGIIELHGRRNAVAARRRFLRSLTWFSRAALLDPRKLTWRAEVADAHAWLSDTYYLEKRYSEARQERLRERAIKEGLIGADSRNEDYRYAAIVTLRSLAKIDFEAGDFERALRALGKARPELAILLGKDPENLVWRLQAVRVEIDASRAYEALGKRDERLKALRQARTLLRQAPGGATASSDERQRLSQWLSKQLGEPPIKGARR